MAIRASASPVTRTLATQPRSKPASATASAWPRSEVAGLRRVLGAADLDAAILGALVLSAGGSGRSSASRHRRLGEAALAYGAVAFATLDEFDDDDALLVSTAVGAPGQGKANTEPRDAVEAAH